MAKKKKLPAWATTVTPFSKGLALFMLVVFPVLGFFYGMHYQKQMDDLKQVQPAKEVIVYKNSNACSQPPDGQVICRSNADCPANYTCAQAGPIRVDVQNHKTCWKKGDAMPL